MQLVREGGLEMRTGSAIRVTRLSLGDYLELRRIRHPAGRARGRGSRAARDAGRHRRPRPHITNGWCGRRRPATGPRRWKPISASTMRMWALAGMPNLLGILEGIWLRNGPLVSLLYPDAKPSYTGRHQHLNVLDGLAARRPAQVRKAVRGDLVEGGRGLVRLLEGSRRAASSRSTRGPATSHDPHSRGGKRDEPSQLGWPGARSPRRTTRPRAAERGDHRHHGRPDGAQPAGAFLPSASSARRASASAPSPSSCRTSGHARSRAPATGNVPFDIVTATPPDLVQHPRSSSRSTARAWPACATNALPGGCFAMA